MVSSTFYGLKFDKHIWISYAKMQQDKLMYCIDLVVYLIKRKKMLFIILLFWQILIIVHLFCHFCDKSSTRKIEKTHERALRFLLNDKTSSYALLLEKSNSTTLHVRGIKTIVCKVFKSLNVQEERWCSWFKRNTSFISTNV